MSDLRKLAEAATPRNWITIKQAISPSSIGNFWSDIYGGSHELIAENVQDNDALFIAAANPQAIIELLDLLEQAGCPNAISDWSCADPEDCQWCTKRKELLDE